MAINLAKREWPLQLKNRVFLTFDMDWAPDEMVHSLIDLCLEHGVKGTFFATHLSPTLDRLRKHPDQFEIGVHPNFLLGSSQGKTEEEILTFCTKLVPEAVSVRSHCVYQHGRLYNAFNQHFGPKLVEISICMPGVSNIQPFKLYTPSGVLIRVPFFWADDYYVMGKDPQDPVSLLASTGCKVYMFHPVHIFHDTVTSDHYNALKRGDPFPKPPGRGIGSLFTQLLEQLKEGFETGLMKEFLNP